MQKKIFIIFLVLLACCSEKEKASARQGYETEQKKAVKTSNYLNDTAHLFSGRELSKDSSLYKYSISQAYSTHKNAVRQSWSRYKIRTFDKMRAFSRSKLNYTETLFYPFGGPDLVNALALFNESKTFILMGLEPIGNVPPTQKLSTAALTGGLTLLRAMLARILGHNFFHTKVMQKQVGSSSFNSIASIMMFFISVAGYEVDSAGLVMIDAEGTAKAYDKASATGHITALRIDFHDGQSTKIVYYFSGDVSDRAFASKQGLVKFVYKQGELTTMLKAASYLMYRATFDDIRNLILARSRVIVQDASGFPYHFLRNKTDWQVNLFGSYVRPIPLFKVRCQPDLRVDAARKSTGNLPFPYGYTSPTFGRSIMIYATRKVEITTPVFDKSQSKGINTYCWHNKLVVEKLPKK